MVGAGGGEDVEGAGLEGEAGGVREEAREEAMEVEASEDVRIEEAIR